MPQDVVLLAGKIFDPSLELASRGGPLLSVSIIKGREFGGQQRHPATPEHPFRVEVRDGVEEDVLADPDRLGVSGQAVGVELVEHPFGDQRFVDGLV
ncbi:MULTISPECIES: hypothetical protein [unclassified Frankia]|uniref:hypothetical protein n=1 Tax=unclassified Frankia TaxID=2632575 RepID=UPI002AD32772|nr:MULTISPECIES: hypothetical protein [unclassified Frankia]